MKIHFTLRLDIARSTTNWIFKRLTYSLAYTFLFWALPSGTVASFQVYTPHLYLRGTFLLLTSAFVPSACGESKTSQLTHHLPVQHRCLLCSYPVMHSWYPFPVYFVFNKDAKIQELTGCAPGVLDCSKYLKHSVLPCGWLQSLFRLQTCTDLLMEMPKCFGKLLYMCVFQAFSFQKEKNS